MKNTFSKGFTLVELLIVISILAALAAAVVVVLNPAELLAQARDAQRLRDMTTVRDAINLHLSQVPAADICVPVGTPAVCPTGGHCTAGTAGPFATQPCVLNNTRVVTGTGWVNINFTTMPGGAALTVLPIDPVNSGNFFYAYRADALTRTFRLATRLESERYRGMMITDGGPRSGCVTGGTPWVAADCFYEVGTNMRTDF